MLAGAMTEAAVAASTKEMLKPSAMLVVDVGWPPADVAILRLNSRLKPPAPGQVVPTPKVGTMRTVLVCEAAFVSVTLPAGYTGAHVAARPDRLSVGSRKEPGKLLSYAYEEAATRAGGGVGGGLGCSGGGGGVGRSVPKSWIAHKSRTAYWVLWSTT